MRPRFICVSSLAIFLITPLYSYDLESSLAGTEQQTKAAISSLTDPNSKRAVDLWNTLGTIHQAQSKLSEAEQDYRRALAINQALSDPSKLLDASILNNLATVLQARRDFSGAETLLKEGFALL